MEFLQEHMVTKEEFNRLDSKVSSLEVKVNSIKLEVLATTSFLSRT